MTATDAKALAQCAEGGCPRCNAGATAGSALDECVCLHAEENALLEAGRERAGANDGGVLYCNTCVRALQWVTIFDRR
jgi:dCMP deaminase